MSTTCHLDFETRAVVDLPKVGAHVYFADPNTSPWCAAYAFDSGPAQAWLPGEPCPEELVDHIRSGGLMAAWNAAFERTAFSVMMGPRYAWPVPQGEQWRCIMVQSYAMAMPGKLEFAAPAAGLTLRKDAVGGRLMRQMMRPRSKHPLTWWDQPEKIERLVDYCKTDVLVERELEQRLRALKPSELELFHLDARINDRGAYVDTELCDAANHIIERQARTYDEEMQELTTYEVTACTNASQLTKWLRRQGVDTDSVAKGEVEDMLAKELPSLARRALLLRQKAAKASMAKVDALLRGMDSDRRARGLLQFHAATTGRWAGRRFQPQNLPKPDMEPEEIAAATKLLRTGDYKVLSMIYDEPLSVISNCLRGMVCAAPGHRLIAADYSNIEGRVLAWLAGEQWKLDAFAEFDGGRAPDLYIQSYARTFGVPLFPKWDPRRDVGKKMELSGGFGGGHGAYIRFGVVGEKAEDLKNLVQSVTDPDKWAEADAKYKKGLDLTREQWVALRITIDLWRDAHPAIRQFWWDLENAAISAIEEPGTTTRAGKVAFKKVGSFLFMRLPSGRFLTYPYPTVVRLPTPWKNDKGEPVYKDMFTHMATINISNASHKVDPKEPGPWARISSYGGKLAENATQATARDVLADAMPKLEAAGYPIVLTVHDEAVVEPPIGHGSKEEVFAIMGTNPVWAEGLPIAVAGFEAERYGK